MFSYGLLKLIHSYCYPEFWIDMEETICNIFADHGELMFSIAYGVLGEDAINIIPYHMERLVA